jgi:uncharacterized protein (DUF4415 family)
MPDLKRQTPRQRREMSYMMEVMRRLEWDLHNTIELTGRIPAEWHEIAEKRPSRETEKVTLRLEGDVLRFFKSMGRGWGPRINDVLASYMHARLAGVIRGAETIAHYRRAREIYDEAKPAFEGEEAPLPPGARMQELMQQKYAESGLPADRPPGPVVK